MDETADLKQSARRIIWGKLLNAGQTCVAPDYVLVPKHLREALLAEMRQQIIQMYSTEPLSCAYYPRIVNSKHFHRLLGLLEQADIAWGGGYDEAALKLEPTLVRAEWEDATMQEEIFGPILPVLGYENLEAQLQHLKELPRPLACYIFSSEQQSQEHILHSLSFGGGCVNDTIMHLLSKQLPFGGVGSSGQGAYHGRIRF